MLSSSWGTWIFIRSLILPIFKRVSLSQRHNSRFDSLKKTIYSIVLDNYKKILLWIWTKVDVKREATMAAADVRFYRFALAEWGIFLNLWIIMAVVFVFKIMTLHSNAGSIGGLAWMKMMVRSMASISKDIYMWWIIIEDLNNCLRLS